MKIETLGLSSGKWLVANCNDIPSDKNCKLVIMGPADQRQDLLDASVAHTVKTHGHADTPELRGELDQLIHDLEA